MQRSLGAAVSTTLGTPNAQGTPPSPLLLHPTQVTAVARKELTYECKGPAHKTETSRVVSMQHVVLQGWACVL